MSWLAAAALTLAPHVFVGGTPPPATEAPRAAGPCAIAPEQPTFLTEGPTDAALHATSVGTMRAVMLLVDFADASATETPEAIFQRIVPESREWLRQVSHGRFDLDVTVVPRWYRMPLSSGAYGLERPTFGLQRAYAEQAVVLAEADVDFSPFDTILVVSPPGAKIPNSPTFLAYTGAGVRTAEKELRWGVTFGVDVRISEWGGRILAHEVQHMLGLPDLYRYDAPGFPESFRDAGGWDLMSWLRPAAHDLVWHKRKLGWIDDTQVVCAQTSVEIPLRANAADEGVKGVMIPIDHDTVVVAELRRPVAFDSRLCDQGLLIYTVEASARSGQSPVIVQALNSTDGTPAFGRCGPKYDATFDRREGKAPSLERHDFTIELLPDDVVRVTYPPVGRRRAVRH